MDLNAPDDYGDQLIARPYQTELEEIAFKRNTIIHLPTGSGKTFIAIRIIKRYREALQRPWLEGGKRTFFLVNTVPLVKQQQYVIKKLCPVKGVGAYSGEDKVDLWNKNKWDMELSKHQVIVMTCQILFDMLTHGYIKIEDINLLIFDECHHAVDDHPMRLIMKHFHNTPVEKQPRVLGLTATLLNSNVNMNKVPEALRDLETTFHATIATANELGEVLSYSTNPHEIVQYYRPFTATATTMEVKHLLTELISLVMLVELPQIKPSTHHKLERGQHDITTDRKKAIPGKLIVTILLKVIKAIKNMIVGMTTIIDDMGPYGGALGIAAYIILLHRLKRKSTTKEEEDLYQIVITYSTEARAVLLDSMDDVSGYEQILKYSSPKFLKMLNILKEYNPTYYQSPGALLVVNKARKHMSGIIFTQQRFTAKILYNLLKEVIKCNPQEFGFIKHDFIVGFNTNPFKSTREQYYIKKCSQKALLDFSNKELNLLISTSVIEEGVDISQCLFVLRFDAPLEYRSYIQSKGRARHADSSFVLMINEQEKQRFLGVYYLYQKTEQYIQGVLFGNNEDREAPTSENIREDLYYDDDIPPYITPYGNRLSAASAISLINRYCSCLPHDQFTVITPMWIHEKKIYKNNKMQMITIIMPVACPVKEKIVGDYQDSLKNAKRSAALTACIRLHQEGELDPVTLLPRSYGKIDMDGEEIRACFLNWPENENTDNRPKVGTKKMVRKHKRVFPESLKSSKNWLSNEKKFYLHLIKMKTVFPEPEDAREKEIYRILQKKEGYGFLTPTPLPKICDFPMFLTVGEVETSLEVNYAVIPLDQTLFNIVKKFHFFIFDEVLQVAKKFLIFNGEDNNLFVVPVKDDNGYNIDWNVIVNYEPIPPVSVPSHEERRRLDVTTENYHHCVVTPWYRGSILPDRYIVTKVIEYMTPQSRFDSKVIGTYADYYAVKYNLEILGKKDQPLLEVRNISSRMNCILPRAATLNAFTDKQQKLISASQGDDKPKAFNEIFVPEFCVKYNYSGALWYKATVLPSIIHRVFMLLVAHDLRLEIARDTKYGKTHLDPSENWLPVENNKNKVVKSLLSQIEEPVSVNTVDRINNPIDEYAPRGLNIVSMKETVYQLQKKKISNEYPWEETNEPVDIERNLSTVTVMDIECYDEFVMSPMITKSAPVAPKSPIRPSTSAAILPPPAKYNDKIDLLTKTTNNRGPELRDILYALTTINSNDCFDLERTETLGDSFLKFASSLYLFHKFPKLNEGQLTNIKGKLIGNRNLFYAGERIQLGGRMKVGQFSPRKDFLVPGFFAPNEITDFIETKKIRPTFLIGINFSTAEALDGSLSEESKEDMRRRYADLESGFEEEPFGSALNSMQCYVKSQAVFDKSVADCVEALIGTYLISGGITAAVKLLEWMRILPPQDNFASYLHRSVTTCLSENRAEPKDVDFLMNSSCGDIEEILQYKFRDSSLLLEAMTHASYITNRITRSYERLEFLGDAILDFLITAHIFENSKNLKPGELTDLRSALVNNVTFASYVVKLGLYKYLCCQLNPVLDNAIMVFVEHQEQRNHEVIEDVLYLIDEDECHIADYVEVPKVLSDIFESLIGAIYLDSGGNLQTVWSVIYRIMWKEIAAFSLRIPLQPVRVLYENVHACASFGDAKFTNSDVPKVMVPVTVTKGGRQHTIHGFGNNKFQAKRAAAKLALKVLAM